MATKYASPAGGGTGNTPISPYQISNFWSTAAPGDTLVLLDGHYTGANSMLQPSVGLAGTLGNPITVIANNDGAVEIDGQGVNMPIKLRQNNNYFVFQGMNCHGSGAGIGAVCTINGNFNQLKRIVAWDTAPDYNYHIFSIAGTGPGDTTAGFGNLIEDCGSFGIGRKNYESFYSNGNTFRRIWGLWEASINSGPKRFMQTNYYSYNTIVDNAIIQMKINNQVAGPTYRVYNNGAPFLDSTIWPGVQTVILSSATPITVGTGTLGPFTVSGGAGTLFSVGQQCRIISRASYPVNGSPATTFMDGTISATSASTVTLNATSSGGSGLHSDWDITDLTVTITVPKQEGSQGLMAEGEYLSSIDTQANGNNLMSGILCIHEAGDVVAYQGSPNSQYAPLTFLRFGNQLLQDAFVYGPGVNEVNKGVPIRGYYLFMNPDALAHGGTQCTATGITTIVPGTVLNGHPNVHDVNWTVTNEVNGTDLTALGAGSLYTGASGGTVGAKILNRYQDGVLTGTPLWPWPMSARIKAATTQASTDGHNHPIIDIDALVQGIFGAYPGATQNGTWFTS